MSTLKRPTLWGPWPQKSAAHPQAATNATPPARLVSCATFLVQVRPNCVVCVCVCVTWLWWPRTYHTVYIRIHECSTFKSLALHSGRMLHQSKQKHEAR